MKKKKKHLKTISEIHRLVSGTAVLVTARQKTLLQLDLHMMSSDTSHKQILQVKTPLSHKRKVSVLAGSKWLCNFLSSMLNSTTELGC